MSDSDDTGGAALVTGGSSGIGLAIAAMLAEEGFATTLVGRRAERLEQAAVSGGAVHPIVADLSDPEAGAGVVAEHLDRWGRLNVLVNNAGVGIAQPLGSIGIEQVRQQADLNFVTPVAICNAAVAALRRSAATGETALIVNTASIGAKISQRDITVYAATKAALLSFTEGLNRELSGDGIRSTALCPGYVDTPMTEGARERGVELGPMIAPSDCAELVRALLRLSANALVPEIVIRQSGRSY